MEHAELERAIDEQLEDSSGCAETAHLDNRPGGTDSGLLIVSLDMTVASLVSFSVGP